MTLIEKLATINKPPVCNLTSGEANSIEELWEQLIKNYLPRPDVVLSWHELLMNYIKSPHPTFAIRGFNSFPKDKYHELRRGFLTNAGEFSFFYTDNFFAAYIQKMALDGYVPSLNEFIEAFDNRNFPSRFGRNTKEERELLAIKQGRDPRINAAGFKVAHIIPVGQKYNYNGCTLGTHKILQLYFPNGSRDDWKLKHDNNGDFYERDFTPQCDAKRYAIAHFLRFTHPMNYFLSPLRRYEANDKCNEIAEYSALLHYAHDYNLQVYGSKYLEFLSYIMPVDECYSNLYDKASESQLHIIYGLNIDKSGNATHGCKPPKKKSTARGKKNNLGGNLSSVNLEMAIEYLTDPNTSFRKLEVKHLHINNATHGGFESWKIINAMGINAGHKGILQTVSLDKLIMSATGTLLETLQNIKATIDKP